METINEVEIVEKVVADTRKAMQEEFTKEISNSGLIYCPPDKQPTGLFFDWLEITQGEYFAKYLPDTLTANERQLSILMNKASFRIWNVELQEGLLDGSRCSMVEDVSELILV